jgi:hypothetical protein
MIVEEFKIKIQNKLFWLLVLIKDLWTWTTFASKEVYFVSCYIKNSLYRGIFMKKNWADVNWLSTLKIHSQFESCEIWNFWKLKIDWTEIKNFKSLSKGHICPISCSSDQN